jgi:hypothetical protein
MEITEQCLRRMVREVDDLHRHGMQTIDEDIAARHTGAADRLGSSRRRFLQGVGLGGLAVAIGGVVVPVAGMVTSAAAQALDDTAIAKFAESIELAAVAAYGAAAQSGKVKTPAVLAAMSTFAGHHDAHAKAFGAFAGDTATAKPNPTLLRTVGDQIKSATDETAVLQIAFQVENGAASTYLFAISAFTGQETLSATASILPVEAQHAAVIGHVLGLDPDPVNSPTYLPPFQTQDQALQPTKFPVAS